MSIEPKLKDYIEDFIKMYEKYNKDLQKDKQEFKKENKDNEVKLIIKKTKKDYQPTDDDLREYEEYLKKLDPDYPKSVLPDKFKKGGRVNLIDKPLYYSKQNLIPRLSKIIESRLKFQDGGMTNSKKSMKKRLEFLESEAQDLIQLGAPSSLVSPIINEIEILQKKLEN